MTQAQIDLMDADHTIQLRRAYHDLDGVDWRDNPPDDRAVSDALRPDRPARTPGAGLPHPTPGSKPS